MGNFWWSKREDMGRVLTLWTLRCSKAKVFDSRADIQGTLSVFVSYLPRGIPVSPALASVYPLILPIRGHRSLNNGQKRSDVDVVLQCKCEA